MAVIKQDRAVAAMKEAVVLDLGDIGRQAARLRMAAEAKAGQIITDAECQAQKLIEGAESQGFEQGQAAGFEQGLVEGRAQGHSEAIAQTTEQLAQLQTAWSDVAGQWDSHRQEMEIEARQAVLDFSLKMSERLLHRVIEVDPTVIVDQLANALSFVLRPLDVVVHIHPADKPILEEAMGQLMAEFSHLQHVHLEADEQVGRGGCVVSYGQGEIDATIDTQLQRVIEMILPEQLMPNVADEAPGGAGSGQGDP
jgi:flagellar assembly protein FliH